MSNLRQESVQTCYSEMELARRLGVSRITILRARQRGELGFYRIGARVVYADHHVQEFLAERERRAKKRRDAA